MTAKVAAPGHRIFDSKFQQGLADVGTFMFGIVLPFIVAVVCGWVVTRFHRKQQRAAVLLFAGSILLMNILLFARFAVNVGSRAAYAFAGPLSLYVLRLRPYLRGR